jgi:hypothetical protein
MKIFILLFGSAILLYSSLFAQTTSKNLFQITRNKNANIVMYDVILNTNGDINKIKPIDAYWILYGRRGQRKEITALEKRAYGYTITFNSNGYYDLILKAVPKKIIKIVIINNEPKAKIKINNKEAYLSKIYAFANNSFTPRVSYYVIIGTDIETGVKITEKITMR